MVGVQLGGSHRVGSGVSFPGRREAARGLIAGVTHGLGPLGDAGRSQGLDSEPGEEMGPGLPKLQASRWGSVYTPLEAPVDGHCGPRVKESQSGGHVSGMAQNRGLLGSRGGWFVPTVGPPV